MRHTLEHIQTKNITSLNFFLLKKKKSLIIVNITLCHVRKNMLFLKDLDQVENIINKNSQSVGDDRRKLLAKSQQETKRAKLLQTWSCSIKLCLLLQLRNFSKELKLRKRGSKKQELLGNLLTRRLTPKQLNPRRMRRFRERAACS